MFRFKRFTIEQDACPMKVGTDGVLLGAWVALGAADRLLLDVGTGTGVIALMLAQRSPAAGVTALDIDAACAEQARANADRSPWGGRVTTCCAPVQEYRPEEPFDLVVSNPPYYDRSLLPPDAGRTTARHTVALTHGELIAAACRLLAPEGVWRSSCRRSRHSGSASRRAAGWRCGG
ncbi:MAG: tRNA1(Val) (adenine(37)-N6)-methyltransferase [Alistipes communis]